MKVFLYSILFVGVVIIVFVTVMLGFYPLKYKNEILHAASVFGVDKTLIASVIRAESGFKFDAVSDKGAVGLMQVMPSTAEFVGQKIALEVNDTVLVEPETNILIGTYYLKYLLDKFGDVKTALIAYNAGEGNVAHWLSDDKYTTNMGGRRILTNCPYKQTNAYVEKVLNGLNFYKFRL